MSEPHEPHGAHTGPAFQSYIYVFLALAICTILSFAVYGVLAGMPAAAAAIIMLVAVIKASLVIWIFMHFKQDWPRVYFIIVPVVILGVMMMFVLLPDIVLAWH